MAVPKTAALPLGDAPLLSGSAVYIKRPGWTGNLALERLPFSVGLASRPPSRQGRRSWSIVRKSVCGFPRGTMLKSLRKHWIFPENKSIFRSDAVERARAPLPEGLLNEAELSGALPLAAPRWRRYKAASRCILKCRSVAQSGSALRSGRRGRRFKSCHSDHQINDLADPAKSILKITRPFTRFGIDPTDALSRGRRRPHRGCTPFPDMVHKPVPCRAWPLAGAVPSQGPG